MYYSCIMIREQVEASPQKRKPPFWEAFAISEGKTGTNQRTGVEMESLSSTSWAPPSTMLTEETKVSLAFS
jgi:hypothetical protein